MDTLHRLKAISTKYGIVCLIGVFSAILLSCGPSREIGFQGRLIDGSAVTKLTTESGALISGTKSMTFRLFNDSDCSSDPGNTVLWTETQNVTVTDGLFNVALGDFNALDPQDFAQPLWLEIEIEGEVLSPCQKLLGAPYAMTLVGGAVIGSTAVNSTHPDHPDYGILNIINGADGTGLLIAVLDGEDTGDGQVADIIRGCDTDDGSTCADLEFKVTGEGNVRADGSFASPASDFAEMMPAERGLQPGDVLVIGRDGKLQRSTRPYQSNVVGVYSTRPGFVGGQPIDRELSGYAPLAIVGVVPVRVTAENGQIQAGDLLTTSSVPGHAMQAGDKPVIGTVLGKALEPLRGESGVIQMLVMLQ